MMNIRKRVIQFGSMGWLLLAILCTGALAHNVRVFAWGEGGEIAGETAFSGGRPARDSEIKVIDKKSGQVLLTTKTDQQGRFRFPIPREARDKRLTLLIILQAGQGHRGEWEMSAADYLETEIAQEAEPMDHPEPAPVAASPIVEKTGPDPSPVRLAAVDRAELASVVSEAVEHQLRPVKRMLAEIQGGEPDFRDILGGIGYLFGLAGLILYCRARLLLKENQSH